MIKAVVFDLDGLLIDSEPLWHQARVDLFRSFNLIWEQTDQKNTMGKSTTDWANYMALKIGENVSGSKVAEEIITRMEIYYSEHVPILPGAEQTLVSISHEYPLALASGSPINLIYKVLATTGWHTMFSEIISGDDVAEGKPAPTIYLSVAKTLRITPQEMVVFEDSSSGILAAHRAGAKIIAVPNYHIKPPMDILDLANIVLESLNNFSKDLLSSL